jgi:hypothetical protein
VVGVARLAEKDDDDLEIEGEEVIGDELIDGELPADELSDEAEGADLPKGDSTDTPDSPDEDNEE